MNVQRGDSPPKRGDVESVTYADPDPAPDRPSGAMTRTGPLGRIPAPDERVKIRLHGHPFTFTVRVQTDKQSGPRLTELAITADEGNAVDYEALRGVPTRRLAYSASQWIARGGGLIALPDDVAQTYSRPDEAADDTAAPKAYRAARIADRALALGLAVRQTVATELEVSKTTVDRLLRRARAEGWFDDAPLPKRPQPPQHDRITTTEGEQPK
jgi:hypothetical protein